MAIEYRMPAKVSANAGRMLTYGRLLRTVWKEDPGADMSPMRTQTALFKWGKEILP